MEMNLSANKTNYYRWTENLFLFFLGFYVAFMTLNSSFFEISSLFSARTTDFLLYSLTILSGLKIYYKLSESPESQGKLQGLLFLSLLVSAQWFQVFMNDGYRFLHFFSILTIGCIGTDYKKILKIYTACVGAVVVAAVLAALFGGINNLVYIQQDRIRSAWGLNYPTDFAAYLVFLCLSAWVAWEAVPGYVFLIPAGIGVFISGRIADSNTSLLCFLALALLIILEWMAETIKKNKMLCRCRAMAEKVSGVSFPVLGLLMAGMMLAYRAKLPWALQLDSWNHHRLLCASERFDQVGFTLYGSPFTQEGAGGNTIMPTEYSFVDCSYLLILLRYGVVIFAVISVLWFAMARCGSRSGDHKLVLAMLVIAIHSLSEHHFTEINYNILLALPFSVFSSVQALEQNVQVEKVDNQKLLAAALAGSMTCMLVLIGKKKVLFWIRTLCTVTGVSNTAPQRAFLLIASLGLAVLILAVCWYFYMLCLAMIHRSRVKKWLMMVPALCIMLSIPVVIRGNQRMDLAMEQNRHVLKADEKAVNLVQETGGCRLYVEDLPELYEKEFGKISCSFYSGEDLARKKNIAVVTDANLDSRVFLRSGFTYTQISDYHAIYTDSETLANSLEAAGFEPSDYFSREMKVDLDELSLMNNLPMTESGSALLADAHPLKCGPYVDLYSGMYEITFSLLMKTVPATAPEYPVCDIQITGENGKYILQEDQIRYMDFDNFGHITLTYHLKISSANVQFLVFPTTGVELELEEITYQRTEP